MAKTLQERYDNAPPSYLKINERRFADLAAGATILIPSPADIDAEIRLLRNEQLLDQSDLRHLLAQRHGADGACPVMTSINLRIVAELAIQALDDGAALSEVTPVWQVIAPESPLATKLPGGPNRITKLRGHNSG